MNLSWTNKVHTLMNDTSINSMSRNLRTIFLPPVPKMYCYVDKNVILMDGWMDELGLYFPSTVFQSFRDDGRMNMKGSVQ